MECQSDQVTHEGRKSAGWVTVAVAAGIAVAAAVLVAKANQTRNNGSVDKVVKDCDAAASRLERLLNGEAA